MNAFSNAQMAEACQTLFGIADERTQTPLNNLDKNQIRSAFKKKAFECHPDRSHTTGRSEAQLANEFLSIQAAYSLLTTWLSKKDSAANDDKVYSPPTCKTKTPAYQKPQKTSEAPNTQSADEDFFWEQKIPSTRLPIGQFLFYSGTISWKTLVKAIAWQRSQRPLFGKIALQWDLLNCDELSLLISRRKPDEKLGQTALRYGLLSHYQLVTILGHQKKIQTPIGQYFVNVGRLTKARFMSALREQERHNLKAV